MKIALTGSLGHISKPLAQNLIGKGHSVTIISSKKERKQDIEALGASAAIGLVDNADFLSTAFAGADAVYAMIPPNYAAPDARAYYQKTGNAYAAAAKKAGVRHIVHLGSLGADLSKGTGFILGSHDVEEIFNKLDGIAVTNLRPGYFYYNLFNFVDLIKGLGFITSNYGGDDKILMASPTDIAAVAAEVLGMEASGKTVRYIASDDQTGNEIARVLGAAIGKPDLKWHVATNEQVREAMEKTGMPAHVAASFVEMGESIHNGMLRQHYDSQPPIVMGNVKLGDFAKEFAAAFK